MVYNNLISMFLINKEFFFKAFSGLNNIFYYSLSGMFNEICYKHS